MSIPKTIGKYQLETLLGEGGMGQVYKAFDPRVRRHLAIKILRSQGLNNAKKEQEFKERFFREGQICGSLNHPNIVTIYEMDEAGGELFIAMEFIQGRPLSKLIGDLGALSTQQQLNLLKQVAGALDYAHTLGVVHRDLKPSNIIWSDFGQAKITDFGIAKLLQGHEAKLTQPGTFVGTPRYASPEQIEGRDVSSKSDIFSFGVLTYETLTGISPFPGSSITEILYKIAAGNVNYVPIDKKLGISNQRIRDIFRRVFHVDPEKRYRKAGDFFAALDTAIQMGMSRSSVSPEPSETMPMEVQDAGSTAPLDLDLEMDRSPNLSQSSRPTPPPPPPIANSATGELPPHMRAAMMDPTNPGDAAPAPSQTLRMPRSFLNQAPPDEPMPHTAPPAPVSRQPEEGDTVKRPLPPVFQKPAPFSHPPTPYAQVSPPRQSPPPQQAAPVSSYQAVRQQPRHAANPYPEEQEKESAIWWILGIAAIFTAFSILGWLAWPELKTLFGADPPKVATNTNQLAPSQDASNEYTSSQQVDASDRQDEPEEPPELPPSDQNLNDQIEESSSGRAGSTTETDPLEDSSNNLATQPEQQTNTPAPGELEPVIDPEPVDPQPTEAERSPKPRTRADNKSKPAPQRHVIEPVVTRRVTPIFPQAGKDAGIEGEVILEAELRFDGKIGNISVLKTLGQSRYGFEDAAVKALLDYEFVPGRIDGKLSTIRKKFHFKFQLSQRQKVDGKRFAELVDNTPLPKKTARPPAENGIQRPFFTRKVPPIFPKAGYEAGMTGNVVLRANLKKDGSIADIQVITGLGDGKYGFEKAAIDAFKQWEFLPGSINGNPADMPIQVSLQFKLRNSP